MASRQRSPARVHILSSINPLPADAVRDKEAPTPSSTALHNNGDTQPGDNDLPEAAEAAAAVEEGDLASTSDKTAPRASRFRFKSKSKPSSSRRHRSRSRSRSRSPRPSSSRHHHHHRHRRRRRRRQDGDDDVDETPNPFDPEPLDPEAAFRASLFDALADDEGAAYWEGVYGQPMHALVPPQGELERMTADEYAAHVRRKMWERTHAGQLEERARREAARERARHEADEAARLARLMESSLRRGDGRRRRRAAATAYDRYAAAWRAWPPAAGDGAAAVAAMAWPAPDGRRETAVAEAAAVRAFFVDGLADGDLAAGLKDERVRWHPDRMQQRLGPAADDALVKDVTAVFQVIDALWADTRPKATSG